MKLVEIIKTKNGLAFLDANKFSIPNHSDRLETDFALYNPDTNYGESNFSYKDYVRKLRKTYHSSFSGIVNTLVNNSTGFKREMSNILYSRVIEFDGDFLMLHSSTSEISYMPYNKVQKINQGEDYAKTGRQKLTVYKFIAKIFKSNERFTEQNKKDFCEFIKSFTMDGLTVEYLEGDAIGKSYAEVPHTGWSSSSCMANKTNYPPEMFTIYNENCQLGIIKNGEEVVGRFLRWKTTEDKWYEDRLYYKSYPVQAWYNERCEKEKVIKYGGEKVIINLKRPFDSYTAKEKPSYVDSLSYKSKDGMQLSNKYDTFNK